MRLSELKTGEVGKIIHVRGRGAFRRRIMEMGFVSGKDIEVIKNAPLKDPIEYSLMDYRVSLRRSEAGLIEVGVPDDFKAPLIREYTPIEEISERQIQAYKKNEINVAFVGNPNAGKTSIFNYASHSNEHTGNYSGVTVDSKTARFVQDGYLFNITDLPGTYSISAYSPEELYVRDFILEKMPDVVVNVVDVSNLERNLYLTTQLIDMDVKVVLALNMYDELQKREDKLNIELLAKLLGIPIIPTVGSKGKGIRMLFRKILSVYNDRDPVQRHIHINYGEEIEQSIKKIQAHLKIPNNYSITDRLSSRFIAIKLLEHDKNIERFIKNATNFEEIIKETIHESERIEILYNEDTNSVITSEKYGFITGALRETFQKAVSEERESSEILDAFFTNKLLGFPIFTFFMWLMFWATFRFGDYPHRWIESGIGLLGGWLNNSMASGSLKDLLIDGVIGGVGGVIVFLPNILILFLLISFMEDSGYMARAVFIMDKLMHKIGLHGKSFIPLIMGFGCNVPAIMATRAIENRSNKLLTMLINPFMSCSARLPVYLLLIGAIFPGNQGSLLFLLYFIGILMAVGVALLFKRTLFRSEDTPFVMELPPYRMPTLRSTIKHMWFKGSQYLKKMGGVILVASVLLWALGYFPREINMSETKTDLYTRDSSEGINIRNISEDIKQDKIISEKDEIKYESMRLENSYIGRLGKFVEPVIRPLGFDWKMGVSLITGIAAKEIVVSTLGVLHQIDITGGKVEVGLAEKLKNEVHTSGKLKGRLVYNPLATISFLIFILIYFPCIAVFAAVKKESGNIWWAVFMVLYTTIFAYIISLSIYQVGSLLL